MIFQSGCGTYQGAEWRFRQFTVDELSLTAEERMIDGWLAHLHALAVDAGRDVGAARLVHWSPAETSNFERAYDNARARHPDYNEVDCRVMAEILDHLRRER